MTGTKISRGCITEAPLKKLPCPELRESLAFPDIPLRALHRISL